jgi:hypothetical protein
MATRLGLAHAGHPSAFYEWTREEQARVIAFDKLTNPHLWKAKRKRYTASDAPDRIVATPEARAFWGIE